MLTMKYYPGSKRKEILTYATAWMNLEDLILNEISQLQKDKYYMMSLLHGLQSTQIHRDRKWKDGCQGSRDWGKGEFNGNRVSVLQDGKTSGDQLQNNVKVLHTNKLYIKKGLGW